MISSSAKFFTRLPVVRAAPRCATSRAAASPRHLSSHGVVALEKLKEVIDEYRRENYTHELPSRCKKELLAVADTNHDGNIPLEGIEMLLKNIGASDRISRNEIETILCEEGQCDNKTIDSSRFMQLI
mmetsp:Transcript_3654/g.8286  ORF Transcript_3654/g.8286 Transcript_3654/m.8286 type:complete len:128 (+) Transcript_3654:120-503(+)|eukprot:CAMPEP_0178527286 /NCGR_PEP_ID=MMETSP0696-20121128/31184_1 /TAXON_ID=265572 /ORGANISM="Extubocellulus spinifer, Strain CCMP396" /LENGTH=127 /DNA_ID=CAMNT_0020158855 /DNA_START=64 /DNA_END=447 /DNA_ORIENTATION=+